MKFLTILCVALLSLYAYYRIRYGVCPREKLGYECRDIRCESDCKRGQMLKRKYSP